ncbi:MULTISPECIES: NADPH-dependent FMN reductase [unclassified Chelatococcus]|uniref:NADPH-dependent FMN reductase n=1 Tax=unclassified Chelatococcus TaxID=2638111 RepID=UPI001BCDF84B|nr:MULTISPECIES: NADPH-dependent FMN reductase [unclassified Chelatococcus]CAH1649754.1 NAD(P)H-dependent FMN reductase [Hyphomicrobiales bacterium]MBS7743400.1 NAD(P)H-dependent oxidoreductase [Chelatococcus sp. HY11]MBX3541482.1 NAD(P)H-dependent oxidoreductase [Chelatococcus sp.]MCO5074624.1 NAD(P)H-dependent oxidoreductase [Chelatococcus sp.]CAH1692175.1 NAD(P)H-dependent FMN reductase [Hyphomicrobiales bacterium]
MTKLLGISGSLRKGSYNSALLRAAEDVVPEGVSLVVGTIQGIPLYNADDEEAHGIPPAVHRLKEQLAAADGLIMFTPEYNNGLPGVFKNAIDWLTRPTSDIERLFKGKPVAIVGASPGGFGTILSQSAWLPVLHTLGCKPWFGGRLLVSRAHTVFNPEGTLQDEAIKQRLAQFLKGFAAFAADPGA